MDRAIWNWVRASWDSARTSLWLVPGFMFLLGAGLAVFMLLLGPDWRRVDAGWARWLNSGSGDDARNLLSTLLTAVISLAGIVFSITIVSLSLAANSFGPRLIRTFRSSLSTQFVMGILLMTIVYLLLVLRAVRGDSSPEEVPAPAVLMGSLLALASVLGLLTFIQGVAKLVVADEVVRRVRKELDDAVRALPALSTNGESAELPPDFEDGSGRVELPREGYVQSVEYQEIVRWAERNEAIVRLDFRPGDFVVQGDQKVLIYPEPADVERVRSEIDRFIVSGQTRTPTQDLEFAVRHLVEVAVRALSPGINDPFTALAVVDRLRGALVRLCGRQLPPKVLLGRGGELRVSRDASSFRGLVDAAFNQIRQAGEAKPAVLTHMLKAIGAIAEHVRTNEQREALGRQLHMLKAAGERNLGEPADLEDVVREYRAALTALEAR